MENHDMRGKMCDENIIKSTYCILKLISSKNNHKIEREDLKALIKKIRDKLSEENDIILDFDFANFPSSLYSKGLNEVLDFSISSNLLQEKYGSIHYHITERGNKFISNPPDLYRSCLNDELISKIDEAIGEILREN